MEEQKASESTGGAAPPAEGDRLLEKEAVAALNGPAPVDPEALKGRFTLPLLLSVAAAACGSSFIFGYNIGAINPPAGVIKKWIWNDSHPELFGGRPSDLDAIWEWAVSLFPLGGVFGGLLCGLVADKFGRKGGMLLNNVFCFIAALLMSLAKVAKAWPMLLLGRFIIGFNCGLNSGLAPMYLIEIAPVNLRGMLGSFNQLMVTAAIFVASVLGLKNIFGQEDLWPLVFAFTAVPAIWQLIALPFCPESPKYLLIVKHQREAAEQALKRLRNKVDVSAELKVMQEEGDRIEHAPKVKFADMFRQPTLRWALAIAVAMMLAQQFSGINAAFYFSNDIFGKEGDKGAKLGERAEYATLGMCLVNVVMTIISTMLVERLGRRLLLLSGMAGMWICSILIVICLAVVQHQGENRAASYASIPFVYLFVVAFATGPGAIPWFYVSELFDQGARGNANAVAVMTNWFANFLVGLLFIRWVGLVGGYAFLAFTFWLTVFIIFTFVYVPETKGRQLQDIQEDLRKKAPPGFREKTRQ